MSVDSVQIIEWMKKPQTEQHEELGESAIIEPKEKYEVAKRVKCIGSSTITVRTKDDLVTMLIRESHYYTIKLNVP